MPNYINCQLKVEGSTESLKDLKSSIISNHKDYYSVNLKQLANGTDIVVNMDLIENITKNNPNMLSLKDTFEDFEFNFRNCNTFYEWVKHLKFTDTSIWVDQEWKKLSLTENELIVNFTAAWTPPIIEIMLGSKLYPDLKFRLTYADISDGFEKGTIEGSNGRFNESKK